MTRLLVIPAAGRGTRLGWQGPKALCPIAGRPMIDLVVDHFASVVSRVLVVVAPAAEATFRAAISRREPPIDYVVQPSPTGMLPAVLCAREIVERHQPGQVWISWCDQVGLQPGTVGRMVAEMDGTDAAAVFPTVRQEPPYIHFDRDGRGRIAGVRQRRDGDAMPPVGESDIGVFAMRGPVFLRGLPEYAGIAEPSAVTGEQNFLPFLPWLAARADVRTLVVPDASEAIGVNTPEDLRMAEAVLRARG
jgi:bifunctional UDP-N-acetylglucosamine pyrophosphorylase/glucosamine-1-phosphate N-acetyltransferase